MAIELESPPEQTAASLVSGILDDLQQLVEQQFHLTRREIEVEFRLRASAAAVVGLGVAVLFLAAIVLCLTVSHLMHWLASSSGSDPASLPLWGCYGIVALALAVSGSTVAYVGRQQLRSIDSRRCSVSDDFQEHSR